MWGHYSGAQVNKISTPILNHTKRTTISGSPFELRVSSCLDKRILYIILNIAEKPIHFVKSFISFR